jgi:hypothetical protein
LALKLSQSARALDDGGATALARRLHASRLDDRVEALGSRKTSKSTRRHSMYMLFGACLRAQAAPYPHVRITPLGRKLTWMIHTSHLDGVNSGCERAKEAAVSVSQQERERWLGVLLYLMQREIQLGGHVLLLCLPY